MLAPKLQLNNICGLANFSYSDLFSAQGLAQLDQAFITFVAAKNPLLPPTLQTYRQDLSLLTQIAISEFLLDLAPLLEEFIAELFNIKSAVTHKKINTISHNPVALFKQNFILRRLKKNLVLPPEEDCSFATLDFWLQQELQKQMIQTKDQELAIALLGNYWLSHSTQYHYELNKLAFWCQQAISHDPERFAAWTMLRMPERVDFAHLIELDHNLDGSFASKKQHLKARYGFKLTDPRMSARAVQSEVHYCIYCHNNAGDFCSKGFPHHKKDYTTGFKKNPLELTLTGCPLEEKISEMNLLKSYGYTIAPLSVIMIDNPMCPATGQRICNDCMKSCIYQKQDPVDIPQVETRILTDVLALPWGVEIYDLLTRWNPLRSKQWLMREYNGFKVLIAGMGPAGFTMAHHLLQEGFAVVGIDGLKIEPFPTALRDNPIYSFQQFSEDLDTRLISGFGGVMEYGITARWDKNFLKLIYLTLSRRPLFQLFGNIRFGGSITVDDVWALEFDHLVLALGAGLPKAINIPGSLARGMRQANDFLMALHLGGSTNPNSLNGIQIRLPAVIIGGGLTGVDTATEVQAYYITQVEKILARYEVLSTYLSDQEIIQGLDLATTEILHEFLMHGRAVRQERMAAQQEHRPANFTALIQQWGGVTIIYRKDLTHSPAYVNNHEELRQAFLQGISYRDKLAPHTVQLDQYGQVQILICCTMQVQDNQWYPTDKYSYLPARAIFVATGTQPNIAYEFEHRGTFVKLGNHYQQYDIKDNKLVVSHGVTHCKAQNFGAFTSYHKNERYVSLIGDSHQVFQGSVVKAIASGMRAYPKVVELFQDQISSGHSLEQYHQFARRIEQEFTAKLFQIKRCTADTLELTIKAPLAAKNYHPGQFYRCQNFTTYAPKLASTTAQIDGLALRPSVVDKVNGILKFIVSESNANSKLCALLQPNDQLALMGPTGVKFKISADNETVLIVGNVMAIALVLSYGNALRAQGNKVIFIALCDTAQAFNYYQHNLEQACDLILWHNPPQLTQLRSQDSRVHKLEILDILQEYNHKQVSAEHITAISFNDVDRIYLIGNSKLLRQFQVARKTDLKKIMPKDPVVYGSVYGPMQCMLKGICAQCLQWQIDPETNQRTKAVFSCSWQDQPLELIDINHIDERLAQNQLHDHLANLWVDYLLSQTSLPKI